MVEVVSSLFHALKSRSIFSELSMIPLTMKHVAKVGERIPPSLRGNFLCFWFMRYDPPPLDQTRRINGQGTTCMLVGPGLLLRGGSQGDCVVILYAFGSCDMILRWWIRRGESTVKEQRACWWAWVFYRACWWVRVFWPFMHCLFWI